MLILGHSRKRLCSVSSLSRHPSDSWKHPRLGRYSLCLYRGTFWSLFCIMTLWASPIAIGKETVSTVELSGSIIDSDTGKPVAARLYVESSTGEAFHVRTASADGSAIPYAVTRGPISEIHTTLSAHPFVVDLPPGQYRLTALRGKEFTTAEQTVDLIEGGSTVELRIHRWIDMADRGWYSGDTHVHRTLRDLPNVVMAEDLNVALPLTYWVTDTSQNPLDHNKNPQPVTARDLIEVDATHVIWPVNTEYELFSVDHQRHTLGAIFFLNHQQPLALSAPPVIPIVEVAREQGALLDLDKHNWPWSMMLLPVAQVDLFELTNNHVWRAGFYFNRWYAEYVPEYMKIEMNDAGEFTDRGWIDFGLKNYYALLNCGFRIKPSAGTASGVHPVPLGYGRVYVHCGPSFQYDRWIEGLKLGNSFVTTGPMLLITVDGQLPGSEIKFDSDAPRTLSIKGTAESRVPLEAIDVIINGKVVKELSVSGDHLVEGSYRYPIDTRIVVDETGWIAVRCFQTRDHSPNGFAHSSPVHVQFGDARQIPYKEEVDYLIRRVSDERDRHSGKLPDASLIEFDQAIEFYKGLGSR